MPRVQVAVGDILIGSVDGEQPDVQPRRWTFEVALRALGPCGGCVTDPQDFGSTVVRRGIAAPTLGANLFVEFHESDFPLSYHHLRLSRYDMGLRDLLSPLRKHRRARSKARSEADAVQDPNENNLAVPRPAESDIDLGAGSSTVPTFLPPALQNRAYSGTRTIEFRATHLTILPLNIDNVASDPTQSVTKKDKRSRPWDRILNRSAATSEDKPGPSWKSTAYASTKVVIDVIKESSDVFVPLKSAAGGLSAVLKHYDV